MAILDKNGALAANISQPFVAFDTEGDYNLWLGSLKGTENEKRFAVIRTYPAEGFTGTTLKVLGKTYPFDSGSSGVIGYLADYDSTKAYIQNEIFRLDGKVVRAKAAIPAGTALDYDNSEVILSFRPMAIDFNPGNYKLGEMVYYEGMLWRATMDTYVDNFVPGVYFESIRGGDGPGATSIPNYLPSQEYRQGHVVVYRSNIYRAPRDFTSGPTDFEPEKWESLSNFPVHINDFNGPYENYKQGDIVCHEGNLYRAKADVVTDPQFHEEQWDLISKGTGGSGDAVSIPDLKADHDYHKGEVVSNYGNLYRAKSDFTNVDYMDLSKWECLSNDPVKIKEFDSAISYKLGECVTHGGKMFRANKNLVSGADFSDTDWDLIAISQGETSPAAIPNFVPSKKYAQFETVYHNLEIYRANVEFTAGAAFDPTNWTLLTGDSCQVHDYVAGRVYNKDDIITTLGKFYRAKSNFTAPATFDASQWELLSGLTSLIIDFKPNSPYSKDESCFYAGKLYRSKAAFTSGATFSAADFELLTGSTTAVKNFAPLTTYGKDEVISQAKKLYRAKTDFTSTATFVEANWEEVSQALTGMTFGEFEAIPLADRAEYTVITDSIFDCTY